MFERRFVLTTALLLLQGFKEEIDGLQEELDVVQNQGAELMTACGEPDKPVIKKSLDEVIDNIQGQMCLSSLAVSMRFSLPAYGFG